MSGKPTYEDLEQRVRELEQAGSKYIKAEETVEYKREMILDSMLEHVIYEDTDMRIRWTNKAACESVNMTREELVGRHCYEIWPERIEPCEDCPVIEAMKTGQPSSVEKNTPDGRSWFIRGYPVQDTKGEIIGGIEITQDVTESKWAEKEQKKLQVQLANAVEMAHLGPWECDVPNNIFTFNDYFYKIFCTTADEVGGYTMSADEYAKQFLHPDDLHIVGEEMRKAIETTDPNYSRQMEHRIIYADGTVGHITVRFFIVKDSAGRTVKTYGVNQDITERKKAEETLRNSYSFSSSLLEHSPNAIIVFNTDTSVRYVNPSFEKITGYTSEEVLGTKVPYSWWIDDPKYGTIEQRVKLGLKGIHRSERHYRKKNGKYFWVEISVMPIYHNGELSYSVSTWIDITEQKKAETERKKLETQLQQAQKLESIGVFAGGIAHDFNNILASILGNVSMAKDQASPKSEIFELLSEAQVASKRAQSLTKQLLTFSKGGTPVKEIAVIKDIIKESSLFVTRGSKSKCEFSIAEDLWPAEVDTGQINQVINNIVINANQAMPDGGIIEIKAENEIIDEANVWKLKPGKYINISIKDEGTGIAERHISKIFDPYFSTKQAGSGLGLSTTYSIIRQHDGHVTAESQLGVATTFQIYLPASEKAAPEKEDVKLIKGKGRILVMDDEASLRKMVGRMLEKLGYEAEFAEDGAEAIEMYKRTKESEHLYDAVILDLTVPGRMGGKEVINKLLEIDPEVKAIVSSGYSDDPVLANYEDHGFKGIMPKPYESSSLSRALHEVLKK
ncbi:PAS domain S-box protein [Thermodesulfobacteriota bacterium]